MNLLWLGLILKTIMFLLLIFLNSIRISKSGFSEFELKRRASNGETEAKRILIREGVISELRAFRLVLQIVAISLFISLAIAFFGLVFAPFFILILILSVPLVRLKFLSEFSNKLYQKHEFKLVKMVEKRPEIFKWLAGQYQNEINMPVAHSKQELIYIIEQAKNLLKNEELSFIKNGLNFEKLVVGDVMIPKSAIDAIDKKETLGPVTLDWLHSTGHSRFPVYSGDIDHVQGILYLHDLVPLNKNLKKVSDAMKTKVNYIREDHDLGRATRAFLTTNTHMLIVINSYRETVGVITLEDVLENILGRKIVDEFDKFDDLRSVAKQNPRHNNLPGKHKDM